MTSGQPGKRATPLLWELAQVWAVDWPEVLRRLKEELGLSWHGLARRLALDMGHLSRLRRGKQRPGHVSCNRILGLAIQHDVLHKVFYDVAISESTRPRFRVPMPRSQDDPLKPDTEDFTGDPLR